MCFYMFIGFDAIVTKGNIVTVLLIRGLATDYAALGHRGQKKDKLLLMVQEERGYCAFAPCVFLT